MPRRNRKSLKADSMNKKRWCENRSMNSITSNITNVSSNSPRINNLSCIKNYESDLKTKYIFVDFEQLQKLFATVKCSTCENQSLVLNSCGKNGFSTNLKLFCSICNAENSSVSTSVSSSSNHADINLRITQAISHIGKGYSAIEKFCLIMNMDPFSSSTYSRCIQKLYDAQLVATRNMLADVHKEIKDKNRSIFSTKSEICDIAVSFDGTWLTRGHTSLLGVSCVIDVLTGYVIDFEVMSKVCRVCNNTKKELGEQTAEFEIWHKGHKSACELNHTGSSASMEMEAALTLWKRSVSYGFRYTTLLSDGDAKTFNYLSEKQIYGKDVILKKEECVNHVSKRLGTGLRNAVKEWKARGVTLGGKSYGSLKESTIKKLTVYYQRAILRNKGNANAMKNDIYATLYHSISTDKKPQHSKCTPGENSWCFYQAAKAKGEIPGSHKLNINTPVDEKYLTHIMPVYQRLASKELLERCTQCKTQNANESLHNMI